MKKTFFVLLICTVVTVLFPASSLAQTQLSFDIVDNANWSNSQVAATAVTETYSYDEATDTVTVALRFNQSGFAPIPPMIALAYKYGFPITFNKPVVDRNFNSSLGPLMGVENTDNYSYQIRGLGKYALAKRVIGTQPFPQALQTQLEQEVQQVISAGHLVPWVLLSAYPPYTFRAGYVNWVHPGEPLYYLSEIIPLLSEPLRSQLITYLRNERNNFPPETLKSLNLNTGVKRQAVSAPDNRYSTIQNTTIPYLFNGYPLLWNLYGLARYYEVVNETPSSTVMANTQTMVTNNLAYRDWSSSYWKYGYTPHFNAIHGVHQMFSGAIGLIRLARLTNNKSLEETGWGLLSRMALVRYAMGKYTQYQYDANLWRPPSTDPAWWANNHWRAGSSWNFTGQIITFHWTNGFENTRQIDALDDRGAEAESDWRASIDERPPVGNIYGNQGQKEHPVPCNDLGYMDSGGCWYAKNFAYHLIYQDLTPELGRFLRDYLKPELELFANRIANENQPHWYIAYLEAVISAEQGLGAPQDAQGHFMTRAWVSKEPPQKLEKYIDVPWLKVGDFYYMHKLAETIKAYKTWMWSDENQSCNKFAGDVDCSGRIDVTDVKLLLNNFGSHSANFDTNLDQKTNNIDIVITVNNLNR